MRVLVAGATGVVGRQLVPRLVAAGHQVTGTTRSPARTGRIRAAGAERADSLSMAFLLVLEVLSPAERAVFLLRDVFDYEYGEIAVIVGKSAENCRQIARRARQRVTGRRPRFEGAGDQVGDQPPQAPPSRAARRPGRVPRPGVMPP